MCEYMHRRPWPRSEVGHYRFGPLDFEVGFRIKRLDAIDLDGVELYIEVAEEEPPTPGGATHAPHGSSAA